MLLLLSQKERTAFLAVLFCYGSQNIQFRQAKPSFNRAYTVVLISRSTIYCRKLVVLTFICDFE